MICLKARRPLRLLSFAHPAAGRAMGHGRHFPQRALPAPTTSRPSMPLRSHPLWLVGFRPFFALACLAGMSLPVLWTLVFSGTVTLPGSLPALRWHAHEMFYGFGWAVLGGFLLTATKNWVQVRGYHGPALQLLVAAWLLERITMWWGSGWPPALFLAGANLFLGLIVAMLAATLIRHRRRDSYRDNYFFLLVLPAFIVAKNLLLTEAGFALGWSMTLGLFRMAFLVMLERTLTPFMKGAFQVDLLRYRPLDMSIKFLGLALVLEAAMPTTAAAAIALLLAALMAARLCWWHPHRALRRLDIGIMYLGYLALVGQLLLDAWEKLAGTPWVGTLPLAAHGIALQIASITFMVPLGVAMAATAIARAISRSRRQ